MHTRTAFKLRCFIQPESELIAKKTYRKSDNSILVSCVGCDDCFGKGMWQKEGNTADERMHHKVSENHDDGLVYSNSAFKVGGFEMIQMTNISGENTSH